MTTKKIFVDILLKRLSDNLLALHLIIILNNYVQNIHVQVNKLESFIYLKFNMLQVLVIFLLC